MTIEEQYRRRRDRPTLLPCKYTWSNFRIHYVNGYLYTEVWVGRR